MAGMLGARVGLKVAPRRMRDTERPEALRGIKGAVFRLDEQVICPRSLIANLASRNRGHIGHVERAQVRFEAHQGGVLRVRINEGLELCPRFVVFCAGEGNASLRCDVGLSESKMQRRPLHMAVVRGRLPMLNGHCIEGASTRVTITSDRDVHGNVIWQLGGRIAETGVELDADKLIRHARSEVMDCVPSIDLHGTQWSTYRVDRAEPATPGGSRPDDCGVIVEGNVITAWPTKLVLAPYLGDKILNLLGDGAIIGNQEGVVALGLREPEVAPFPWERDIRWKEDN